MTALSFFFSVKRMLFSSFVFFFLFQSSFFLVYLSHKEKGGNGCILNLNKKSDIKLIPFFYDKCYYGFVCVEL